MFERILANFALHIKLDETETDHIESILQHKVIKKNVAVLNEGEVCRSVYFVNNGCLRVFHTDAKGDEYNMLFCPENWWAMDIASFSRQRPSYYSIAALEDTEVFYIDYETLEKLYITVPSLERFFRILTQNGFYLYQRRFTDNQSRTAKERYKQFQLTYPGLEQRITQKHIASYLGITPVFLSMLRSQF